MANTRPKKKNRSRNKNAEHENENCSGSARPAGTRTHIVLALLVGILAIVGSRYHRYNQSTFQTGIEPPDWYNLTFEESELKERQEKSSCGPAKLYQSLFVDGSSTSSSGIVGTESKVQIAVDVYLPCDYSPSSGHKFPLYFHMTRYGRRLSVRWPFSIWMANSINTRSKLYVSTFVPSGYALVTMDVRGSGASGGSRSGDLLSNEIDDCMQVLQWAKQQPWFGDKVVSGGISYDGMLAAALGARGVLDVALLVFSPLNVYEELAVPGGVPCKGFVDPYSYFTAALETATAISTSHLGPLSIMTKLFFNVFIEGPAPPTISGSLHGTGDNVEKTLFHIEQHAHNWNIRTVLRHVLFADDVAVPKSMSNGLAADYKASELGINPVMLQQLVDSKVKIMSYSGYYDSGAVRTSATLFEAASAVNKKGQVHVTVGPWTHGVRQVSSPFAKGRHVPAFSLGIDLLRFSDFVLGRRSNMIAGLSKSNNGDHPPLVRVFELQSHTWHTTNSMNWASPKVATNTQLDNAADNGDIKISSMMDSSRYEFYDSDISTKASRHRQMLGQRGTDKSPSVIHTLSSSHKATSLVGIVSRWNLIQQILLKTVHTNIPMYDVNRDNNFAKFIIDLTGNENEEDRIHYGIPKVGARVRVRSSSDDKECAAEASLFFYLLLQDDSDGKEEELKYLTETQLRLGHGPLDSIHQRDFTRANFEPLALNQYYALEVGLEPLRFSWQPSRQKLVLLIGRKDDANFLEPHPENCPNGQQAEMVDLIDVSVDLPTFVL